LDVPSLTSRTGWRGEEDYIIGGKIVPCQHWGQWQQWIMEKLFKHMVFLEPACDGQHGYQVPSVNSSFIDIQIHEPMLN
jgi:hypothetical protein